MDCAVSEAREAAEPCDGQRESARADADRDAAVDLSGIVGAFLFF